MSDRGTKCRSEGSGVFRSIPDRSWETQGRSLLLRYPKGPEHRGPRRARQSSPWHCRATSPKRPDHPHTYPPRVAGWTQASRPALSLRDHGGNPEVAALRSPLRLPRAPCSRLSLSERSLACQASEAGERPSRVYIKARGGPRPI